MQDIGPKFEYGYFYSFSFKKDTILTYNRHLFGASVCLKYYCVLSQTL